MDNIFILIGTNTGNLSKNLKTVLHLLKQNKIRIINRSKVYKTKPWGNKNQPDFLNMAVEISCDYSPAQLLRRLKTIETSMGRKLNKPRWSPRIIDLDILFYGNQTVQSKTLTIPHKEVYNRPFALIPLAEISPDYVPPGRKKRLSEYVMELDDEGIAIYHD